MVLVQWISIRRIWIWRNKKRRLLLLLLLLLHHLLSFSSISNGTTTTTNTTTVWCERRRLLLLLLLLHDFCVEDMRALKRQRSKNTFRVSNETLNTLSLKEREAKTRQFSRAFIHIAETKWYVLVSFFPAFHRR